MSPFIAPIIQTPAGECPLPIRFGLPGDADALRSWRIGRTHTHPPAARDAVEYARLASKRWRYYARRDEVAKSLPELRQRAPKGSQEEVGFLLVAGQDNTSAPQTLAMAWCRRTWCHHLVLDFLACHPVAFDARSGYGGVGSAMLFALGLITSELRIPLLWGEATAVSAGFYSKRVLGGQPVTDHFFIRDTHLANLQREGKRSAIHSRRS